MKFVPLLLAAFALLSVCDAGILKTIGKGSENLGQAINQGAIKTEDTLSSLFGGKKPQPQKQPEVPAQQPNNPFAQQPNNPFAQQPNNPFAPQPNHPFAPQQQNPQYPNVPTSIVRGGYQPTPFVKTTTTEDSSLLSAVITDDDDTPAILPGQRGVISVPGNPAQDPSQIPEGDRRETIGAAPRCAPDEAYVLNACRPKV